MCHSKISAWNFSWVYSAILFVLLWQTNDVDLEFSFYDEAPASITGLQVPHTTLGSLYKIPGTRDVLSCCCALIGTFRIWGQSDCDICHLIDHQGCSGRSPARLVSPFPLTTARTSLLEVNAQSKRKTHLIQEDHCSIWGMWVAVRSC